LNIPTPETLFDGHSGLFLEALHGVSRYGEYGMGQSTLAVAANTSAQVQSVDTALAWVERVETALGALGLPDGRVRLSHVDVGPVGNWGFPLSYDHSDRFADYFVGPWARGFEPDLVLIDGRFRVACFLTSLLHARTGTRLLFDDYSERRYYHIVETFLQPDVRTERQALFSVPAALDRTAISALLDRFSLVMD
jgi:hypothetical protein